MERALDLNLLLRALGTRGELPSPALLASWLAAAEVDLLLQKTEINSDLVATGWYLFGVASSRYATRQYGVARQRAAFRVSAHIFDLTLRSQTLDEAERFRYCFAAQIAYLRSELDPNATALFQREVKHPTVPLTFIENAEALAFRIAVSLLGMRLSTVSGLFSRTSFEISTLVNRWQIDSIYSTPFAAPAGVINGSWRLAQFLRDGSFSALKEASEHLSRSVAADNAFEHQRSRWVAAHLLQLAEDLPNASIWTKLPPDVPPSARHAFTYGWPPIMTLWPPQLDFVNTETEGSVNPFSKDTRRFFISLPTSAGKTTIAQMLIVQHVATASTGVIYVAPTRSLCREVRDNLENRLRGLDERVEVLLNESNDLETIDRHPRSVRVMTPEHLYAALQKNGASILEGTGLFVFDEIQHIADTERGWTVEACLSYLHMATENTQHRIALLAPGIGNQFHFTQWLHTDQPPKVLPASDWRGPRRMTAIWSTQIEQGKSQEIAPKRKNQSEKRIVPLKGQLDIRLGGVDSGRRFVTDETVGELCFSKGKDGRWSRNANYSTPHYKSLIPLLLHLEQGGPVLVFEAEKKQSILTAQAIANACAPSTSAGIIDLISFVATRLGRQHPLINVLERRVAFHYGPLPDDIRNAIEDAFRQGDLRYLVATTTVADGVNLPCHAVVVANTSLHAPGGEKIEILDGIRLVNAIGRAGRAARETEGIVVLARPGEPKPEDVRLLFPASTSLEVHSTLTQEDVLKAAEEFWSKKQDLDDAAIQQASRQLDEFMAFIWFFAHYIEIRDGHLSDHTLADILQRSLAWHQLDESKRAIWQNIGTLSLDRYRRTPHDTRARWATSGMSLRVALELESVVKATTETLLTNPLPDEPRAQIRLLLEQGRLERILELPYSPNIAVYTTRGKQERILLPLLDLLADWLDGVELRLLSEKYLSAVNDIGYRFEQLTELIYQGFEVYLPKTLAVVIPWVNSRLSSHGSSTSLSENLPTYVRWGVGLPVALELLGNGLGSRSLAMRIAHAHRNEHADTREWLRGLSTLSWTELLATDPSETRILLKFVRSQSSGLLSRIQRYGSAEIAMVVDGQLKDGAIVSCSVVNGDELMPIEVRSNDQRLGTIRSQDQLDALELLRSDIDFSAKIKYGGSSPVLAFSLADHQ